MIEMDMISGPASSTLDRRWQAMRSLCPDPKDAARNGSNKPRPPDFLRASFLKEERQKLRDALLARLRMVEERA